MKKVDNKLKAYRKDIITMNVEDKKIGIIDQFVYAISNSREYKKLTSQSMGRVLNFALLMAFMLSLITYVLPTLAFHVGVGGLENLFLNKIPKFEIKNGVMTIEEPIEIQGNGVSIVVNSDEDTFSAKNLKYEQAIEILISKKNVVVQDLGQVFIISLDKLEDITLNNQSLTKGISYIYFAEGITLFFMIIGQFCWYLLSAFGYACFGLSLVYLHKKQNFTLSRLFKIAIYSKVLCAMIGAMNEVLHSVVPFELWYSISMFVTFFYISRAIRYSDEENKKLDLLS